MRRLVASAHPTSFLSSSHPVEGAQSVNYRARTTRRCSPKYCSLACLDTRNGDIIYRRPFGGVIIEFVGECEKFTGMAF